jgi:ubiquinol oxidase
MHRPCYSRARILLLLQIRDKLKQLKLSNKAVWDREHAREAAGGGVDTPWYVRAVYYSLCLFLDVAFDNR